MLQTQIFWLQYQCNLRVQTFDISNLDYYIFKIYRLKYLRTTPLGCRYYKIIVCSKDSSGKCKSNPITNNLIYIFVEPLDSTKNIKTRTTRMPNTCENIREELVRINVVLPVVGQGCIFFVTFISPPPFASALFKIKFELRKLMIFMRKSLQLKVNCIKKNEKMLPLDVQFFIPPSP